MTQPLRPRADAMVERVSLEVGYSMGPAAGAVVADAVRSALAPRDATLADDHDPRLLHPARTVLILLSDDACRDADVLCAAAFAESLDEALRGDAAGMQDLLGARATRLTLAVPLPRDITSLNNAAGPVDGEDDLLERLVSAEPAAAVVALAEMLDHTRHLHLRPGLNWRAIHRLVNDAYVPAAARLSPQVGRRLQRWAEAFGSRRLVRRGLITGGGDGEG
jgi:hypothetical protein